MTTLTFTRASGNVPVVDADSGAVLGDHFLPLFLRGSFELAGIAALKEGEPKLLFTPPEIVFINRICALVKPEEGRTPEAPDLENGPYAPMEQTIVYAQGGVPMGRISSISVDQKTGAPACFSVEPLGPGEAVKEAPAKEEESVCSEPEVCEGPKDEAPAVEPAVCEEPETEVPEAEPEVNEPEVEPEVRIEPDTEVPSAEPEICEEPETEAPVVEPEICEEPETEAPAVEPKICEKPETEAPEAPAEPEAPAAEAMPEEAEEPEADPDDDPDSLPTIDWLLAGRDKPKTPTGLSIDLAMDEDHARYEKALTEAPAPAEEGADPLSYEAYYEDTTPEQFLKKLEGLLSPTAFEKSEIPDPPQMIDSVLFEPDVVPGIAAAEKTGEPLPEGRLADIAELLAEKYEARPASEAPKAEEPEKAPAAPEEPAETAAEPAAEEAHEPVIETVTEPAEEATKTAAEPVPETVSGPTPETPAEPAETAAEEKEAPSAEQEAPETPDAAPAPEAPETAPAAPAAKSSDVTFRHTASYRPEEFNLNAPEDYYRPNVNYTKQLQKRNGSQILGMLLFCGACLLMSML